MNMRNKLLLAFLISTVTPILLLCLIIGNSIRKDSLDEFHKATHAELSRIEKTLSIFINDIKENVVMASKSPDVGIAAAEESTISFLGQTSAKSMIDLSPSLLEKRVIGLFQAIKTSHPHYIDVYMATSHGGFILENQEVKVPAGFDPRTRFWYRQAVGNPKDSFLTKAYKSVGGDPVVSISNAISSQGKVSGVVAFDVSLKKLTQLISNIHIGKTGYVILIQDDGVILADPGHSDTGFKKLNETEIAGLAELGKHSSGGVKIELDGKTYIAEIVTSDNLGWKLVGLIQKSEVMSKVYGLLSVIAVVGIILVAIFVIVGFFMARSLASPITQTTAMIKEIAQGNLTKRLAIKTKDELGDLAKYFNFFVESLQGIIGELKENVTLVDNSSADLLNLSNEMNDSAIQSSDLIKTVVKSSDIINGNMTNVASSMEQTTENTNIVATASEEMSATINEISKNSSQAKQISEQAVEQMKGASEKMHKLGNAAESISAVTDAIAGISDQTNLLALNATIEAARAGEAGKGFAVVANEIKALASQTAEATADIKQQIEGIQATSNETIGEMESVNKVIEDINGIIITIAVAIEEQAAATQEIASNISHVSQGTQDVNENITQSSQAIEKAHEDVASMNTLVENISGNSSHIAENLEKLKDMAKGLTKIVNQFII